MTSQEAKRLARNLFLKTLPQLDAGAILRETLRCREDALEVGGTTIPLHTGRPISVISLGKAALEMTGALAAAMPQAQLHGVVSAPSLPRAPLPGFEYFQGGHPIPSRQSWQAAEAALTLLGRRSAIAEDLTIFLISGGGSAMMEKPLDPAITLERLQEFYRVLVGCGATIAEMNTLRKHFSMVKAGRLAQAAAPARQLTLYVSDVPDGQHEMVASGPTMPDSTTFEDCRKLFDRPELRQRLSRFRDSFSFISRQHEPTPKGDDLWFAQSIQHCLLAGSDAVRKLAERTRSAGVTVDTDTSCDDWDLRKAADHLLHSLRSLRRKHSGRPVALVSGGELSCPIAGAGTGGRNQAFVLHCAQKIKADDRIAVLSAGTDGIDGNSPAAGAVADGETVARAAAMGMDAAAYENHSDSFAFFHRLGDTIVTGPTGTNVRDLRLLLAY